ncbi:hypothetical protein WJX84_001591 [Apatococcus fuscideae]|uniref:PAS domain-containing protein n=1 Tax=Apatococcus fuscideae TaxID=2026836 RepID=A0AAW1T5E7_9CHLO
MLIDIELIAQPIVFVSQALLKILRLSEDELVDRPWKEVLQTPFRHEAQSDVQGRIQEAFCTGCEFREIAACFNTSQELITLQLLFLPVAKDPESGITHYICIIVAHNEGKAGAKDPDATSPVPLPKLPVNLDDVPTARYVSVTMKSLPKEQLLGLTSASASGGSPRPAGSPKIRRPSSLGLAVAGFPSIAPEQESQPAPPKPSLLGRGKKNSKAKVSKRKSRFATEAGADEEGGDDSPGGEGTWAEEDGPLGNLRYDSALMGAISSQKGQKVPLNRVPRTKEEVWLHRLRDMLTTEIGSSEAIAKPETLALANATTD